jgi:hypothetical protein
VEKFQVVKLVIHTIRQLFVRLHRNKKISNDSTSLQDSLLKDATIRSTIAAQILFFAPAAAPDEPISA